MNFRIVSLFIVALPTLAGCLQNREELTIRPDGSAVVRVRASGPVDDLADGYPVPLHEPWKPAGDGARLWLKRVGPDTGSDAVREKVRELKRSGQLDEIARQGQLDLEVEATFASIDRWPRHAAPASAPHRTAYLERSARLDVEKKGERRVYRFERVFHRRRGPGRIWDRVDSYLPKELKEKFEKKELPTREEWLRAVPIVSRAFQDFFERVAREVLVGFYLPETSGQASLPVETLEEIVLKNRKAVDAVVTEERLGAIYDWIREQMEAQQRGGAKPNAGDDSDEPDRLERLEIDAREAVRATLDRTLSDAAVGDEARRAALDRLEERYTAIDQTVDLLNERFTVELTLPGTVVAGNYDRRIRANRVEWQFEGKDLEQGDRVLRAVSVLE